MDDIVTRLRELGRYVNTEGGRWFEPITTEAADEIERLRAEVKQWRDMADNLARFGNCESPDCPDCDRDWKLIYQDYEKAVRGE